MLYQNLRREKMLKKLCLKNSILKQEEYQDRFQKEFEVISEKGFEDYFLILKDVVDWARSQGILVGPGRGSSGGSLIAYLLGITKIDPLKYDLMFERFLDSSRMDLPDVDVDFQASRRPEVFDYIKNKYGEEYVCQIMTFSKFHVKQVFRDLARIHDIDVKEVNLLAKKIPPMVRTLEEAQEIPEVQHFLSSYPQIKSLAPNLEGAIRQRSIHAAGIIITPKPILNYMSVEKMKGNYYSCFDMDVIDKLGLLKIDILSLRTLDVIAKALELIGLTEKDLPLECDDEKVYEIFQNGNTLGLFQFETTLLTGLSKKLQIKDFITLYTTTAIARPGPLHSGETDRYIKRHLGEESFSYLHDTMKSITSETYGLLVFQEQIMRLSQSFSGFTGIEANRLRKVIGKSKGVEEIDKFRDKFMDGAIEKATGEQLWEIIREAGAYSFNKSHSVAYSMISYWCAWLKTYYPKEFLVALMNFEEDEVQADAVRELRDLGTKVKAPDINLSQKATSLQDDEVYMGFQDIENCGEKAVEEIINNQPYTSFEDFLARVQKRKVNVRVVRSLIQAGCFDKFERRDKLYYSITDEEKTEWDDQEMLRRQVMFLDMPTEKPLIDYYEIPYQHLNITLLKDIDFSQKKYQLWVKGVILDLKVNKVEGGATANFFIDDGTKRVLCYLNCEQHKIYKDRLSEGAPVIALTHIYGTAERLTIDGLINITNLHPLSPIEKLAKNGRKGELTTEGGDVIVSVEYRTSKKGKRYVSLVFDGDDEPWLGFNQIVRMNYFEPGEIVTWNSNKKPFINIESRR
jgi:DNA polymerase-3 subunit alpha